MSLPPHAAAPLAPVKDIRNNRSFFQAANGRTVEIREVWDFNVEEEMANIRDILEQYPFIAMVWSTASACLYNYI